MVDRVGKIAIEGHDHGSASAGDFAPPYAPDQSAGEKHDNTACLASMSALAGPCLIDGVHSKANFLFSA
jgi:hypothetical protein